MTNDEAKKIINENRDGNYNFIILISKHVQLANYSLTLKYKMGFKPETNQYGVLQLLLGKWIWSWHNTIDSNYSCFCIIMGFIEKMTGKKITADDFNGRKLPDTYKFIDEFLYKWRDYLFSSNSDEFNDMKFITQKTWIQGLISEMSSILTMKFNNIVSGYTLSSERGNADDIKKGRDYFIKSIYGDGFVQDKLQNGCFIIADGLSYSFKYVTYLKDVYTMKNIQFFVINTRNFVYAFHNSDNTNLIKHENRFLIFDNSLLIHKPMRNSALEMSDLLYDINQYLSEKHIQFTLNVDTNITVNNIKDIMDDGERIIIIEIANADDELFLKNLIDFFNEIKTTL